jgi:hypothetical protein
MSNIRNLRSKEKKIIPPTLKNDMGEKELASKERKQIEEDPKPFLKWKYKFDEIRQKEEFVSIGLSDGSEIDLQSFEEALKRATGTSSTIVAEGILRRIASGMSGQRQESRLNAVATLLPSLRPRDETEALLLGQFLALQDSAMDCLRRANLPEQGFYHEEKLFILANKLLNTANQTMQTILKYRSGGQQTVQVVHVHNEGQAIVTQNLSHTNVGEGVQKKSEN